MEGHELLGAASAHQDQERLDEGRGTRIVSRSLSVDTWTRHSSTDGAPPIFENQATGEITQAVPSNSIVYDDSGEKALYTFGNVLDDSVSAGEVWERKIDPVSLRPYYFCSRKGISSWVMPPNAWSERTTLSKARSSFHPPTQDIIQVDANKVERENLVVELAEAHRIEKDKEILNRMMTETAKRWTVHVGEDDSRVFYRNGSGGVQFANPYVFEDETQKNINKEADLESDLHVLLGEGAKPDTVELSNSRAHLSTWITTLHLHVESPWNEASLKYPENVQPIQINGNGYEKLRCRADQHPPLPFQHPFTIFATVKGHMADAHSVFFAEKTIKFSGGDTLGTVMRSIIFPKFRISEKMDKYVLKVAGVKSYLLHDDYPMLWYEYVQEQVRESEGDHVFIKPTFTLVELPPEDEDGVSLLRKRPYHTSTEGTEDEREHFFYSAKMLWERTKDTPELVNDEDRFRATRSQLLIRYGIECFERYPDLVSSPRALEAEKCMPVEEGSTVGRCTCLDWDVFSGSHVDQVIGKLNRGDSISSTFLQWPVRFFIKSLHGLRSNRFVFGKETCVVESIRLDCGIYDRGDIVAECKSSAKLLDSSVYWSSGDSQVQFRHIRVANLTPSSRVGVCLVGIMSDGKEEIIAVGAIRLFDEVGLLWQGRTTLYLSKWSGQMGKVADRVLLMPESRHNGMCKLTLECERFNKPVVYPNCSIRNIMHVAMQQKQGIALTAPHSKTTLRCEGAGALYIVAVSFKALHEIKIIQSSASPGMTMAEKMDIVNSFCKNVEASLRTRFLSIMTAELQITETDLAELEAVACKEKIPPEKIHFYTQLLWEHRYRIVNDGRLLRKFLRIVQWGNFEQAEEARALLGYWAKPTATEALSMLGIGSSDSIVRGYAVWVIGSLDDDDLADYLLQLVQCLKLERHHDSALFRFLLRRGLKSPHRVGHYLYWYLRSELHDEQFHSRFRLLLETYLTHCGPHRKLLVAQAQVVKQLETITKVVMKIPKKESQKRVQTLRHEIELCDWPEEFEICLWPGYNCRGVVSHKCKVMDSKMAPLWIEFENADPAGDNVRVIFKVGDDLRQDQITLQFIKIVNKVALKSGNDLRMQPYRVVGTGDMIGMVEVVPRSDTIARMQWAGGGPYDKNPLFDFILANSLLRRETMSICKPDTIEEVVDHAVRNFLRSCAGYVVTTYVMGIGDRHPSNIMMQTDGHLFHIDFGHFLGNFKTKKIAPGIKIKRERSPLVFTPQMLHVLNPARDEWDTEHPLVGQFLHFAAYTFEMLRRESSLFTSLFTLMVPAGLPELKSDEDVDYMRRMLRLDLTDSVEAQLELEKTIKDSVNTSWKQIDDWMHMMAHKHGGQDGNSALLNFYKGEKLAQRKAPFYYYDPSESAFRRESIEHGTPSASASLVKMMGATSMEFLKSKNVLGTSPSK
jgi:hypothetical protein